MCTEQAEIKTVIVKKFKTQQERDNFELDMQWLEDKAKYLKLITPTSINELDIFLKVI